jgi:hypothetical protein
MQQNWIQPVSLNSTQLSPATTVTVTVSRQLGGPTTGIKVSIWGFGMSIRGEY